MFQFKKFISFKYFIFDDFLLYFALESFITTIMNRSLILMIEEKLGKRMRYPKECDALAKQIHESTGKRISASTLKRIFGFINPPATPSLYTLDVLSGFLGFFDWDELENLLSGKNGYHSNQASDEVFDAGFVKTGQELEICYLPDRKINLLCMQDGTYKVTHSQKSALKENDIISVDFIALNSPLKISSVVRNSNNFGPFTSLKSGDITSVRCLN